MPPKLGSCILLTGVTGFLGKVVLQELFRRRDDFEFDKIIVLIRSKQDQHVCTRFREDVASLHVLFPIAA
jgi:thioester reductase-like protein